MFKNKMESMGEEEHLLLTVPDLLTSKRQVKVQTHQSPILYAVDLPLV